MAKIFYSMCGEGRGHATRSQTIVEMLLPDHDFVLLAARDAYHQLCERYQDHPQVSVRRLPGLYFSYRNEKVDYARSVMDTIPYLYRLRSMVRYVEGMIERENPTLAITDFEPILPRAASNLGIPCISLDHQHFLSSCDFRSLPWRYRWRALFLRIAIPLFYRGQVGEAVSAFYHLPLRKGAKHVHQLGVMLRASVIAAKDISHFRNHLLVYVRKHPPKNLVSALQKSGRRCIVYGLGQRPAIHNIEFQDLSEDRFVEDLARCDCLISTAGNQLIGEAYYLGKPVLALPEPGNFEQQLNGWLIKQSQGGWSVNFDELTPHVLQQFLLAAPALRKNLGSLTVCGNSDAIEFIEHYLAKGNKGGQEIETVRPSRDKIGV